MERICKAPHVYGGKARQVGERFDVDPADFEIQLSLGRIEREESDRVPGYVPRDMAAQWAGGYETRDLSAERVKRTYNRKAN